MQTKLSKEVEEYLNRRLRAVLEWYTTGAVACEETKRMIYSDINYVLDETIREFDLKTPLPFTFRVSFDDFGIVTVEAIDKKLD